MEKVIATIKKIWPNACISISQYDKNCVGYVSNGKTFGTKGFASGWAEDKEFDKALTKAFKIALHNDYERNQ